jgi:hypothetical protein
MKRSDLESMVHYLQKSAIHKSGCFLSSFGTDLLPSPFSISLSLSLPLPPFPSSLSHFLALNLSYVREGKEGEEGKEGKEGEED